jgi:hypothetical protein
MEEKAMIRFQPIAAACLMTGLWTLGELVLPAFGQTNEAASGVANMAKTLKDDARKFRSSFGSALGKSPIGHTSEEKEAKALASRFIRQIDNLANHAKDNKQAEADLQTVLITAERLETVLGDVPEVRTKTAVEWKKVRSDLSGLSAAFGLAGSRNPGP